VGGAIGWQGRLRSRGGPGLGETRSGTDTV
jgi:hypothetical protein